MQPHKTFTALFGDLQITLTQQHINADKIACLKHDRIDIHQLQTKAPSPVLLPITPIIWIQEKSHVHVFNEHVVLKMLHNNIFNPKDLIVCCQVDEADIEKARMYYQIIDRVQHIPSNESIMELMLAAYDPNRLQQRALILQVLCKHPHESIVIDDIETLIKSARKRSILSSIKSQLGFTHSPRKTAQSSPSPATDNEV